jgi:DnaJ-class molecular chaperone
MFDFKALNAEADKRLKQEVRCPTCHGHKMYQEGSLEKMKWCGDCRGKGYILQELPK